MMNEQDTGITNLPGYRQDVINLCSTFWIFGFDLRVYVDLTGDQMLKTAEKLTREENKSGTDDSIFVDYASVVVCILSHGTNGQKVVGVDNKLVDIEQLRDHFNKAKALSNKFKLFVVQMCREYNNNTPPSAAESSSSIHRQNRNENQRGICCSLLHTR